MLKGDTMSNYVSIQNLDLSKASLVGFNNCRITVEDSNIVCSDYFGRKVALFPFDLNSQYLHTRGLPEDIGIDEEGNLEVFEIDFDDEDYFGPEEQPVEILEGYSYISTMNFTLVINTN